MTKQEFQKRIGAEISQKDYSIVEHVYTWHPSISEVEGKEQIAELYKSYGKKKTGIEKMEKELRCRVSGQKLVEDAENGYKDVRELFNQFITGPKGENREIPELTQAYERLRAVMEAQVPGAKADTAITSAVYDVAIESEMQGFIYGFQLFGAVLQGCGSTRRCAGEN